MLDMSQENVLEMPSSPASLSDSEKLKIRDIQLKIANITASKLKLKSDFEALEKMEAKSAEEYNQFIEQFSAHKDKYGLDYETLSWVALDKKG